MLVYLCVGVHINLSWSATYFAHTCPFTHMHTHSHATSLTRLDPSDQTDLQHRLWTFLKQSASTGVEASVCVPQCVCVCVLSCQVTKAWSNSEEDNESLNSARPRSDKTQMWMQINLWVTHTNTDTHRHTHTDEIAKVTVLCDIVVMMKAAATFKLIGTDFLF